MKEPIIKYLNRIADKDNLKELYDSLSDDEKRKEFAEQKNNHALVSMLSGGGETDSVLWDNIKSKIESSKTEKTKFNEKKKYSIRLLYYATSAAAVLLLLTNAISLLFSEETILEVPKGQKAIVFLSDGTKVTLSSDSKLEYPARFSIFNRKVELKGEAFFEVSKKTFSSFIVSAGEIDVKVLGTKFNVSAYPGDTLVSVYLKEGSVCCYAKADKKNSVLLEPNQQIVFGKSSMSFEVPVDQEEEPLWTKGIYQLKDKTMGDALELFERIYNVEFYVTDPLIHDIRINGSFSSDDSLDDILSAINSDKKLKITRKNQQIAISMK